VDVGHDEFGCRFTAKDKQNEEGCRGANPDRRIQPESAAKKKLCRRRPARGIRYDETGNNKENLDSHPAKPREGRGRRIEYIGADGTLEPRVANRNPGPRPEQLVKKCDAEGGPEAQRIQQEKMVLNGSAPNA
jgi:hypothetical protein